MSYELAHDMETSKRDYGSQPRPHALTSAQIRAARSLIRWTADDLAEACALSVATIRRAELKENETALTTANDLAIRRALEGAGIEFIDEDGGGPGVRLRKRHQKKS
jgi:transcriptional regulator with XRE-family HTH domain